MVRWFWAARWESDYLSYDRGSVRPGSPSSNAFQTWPVSLAILGNAVLQFTSEASSVYVFKAALSIVVVEVVYRACLTTTGTTSSTLRPGGSAECAVARCRAT